MSFCRLGSTHLSRFCTSIIESLQLCESAYAKSLLDGMLLHHHITKLGLDENTLFQNLALQMYASCGALLDALHIHATTRRPNLHSWDAVIQACGIYGLYQDMCQLFYQMQQEGMMPDTHILVSLLSQTACTDEGVAFEGKCIHARTVSCPANAALGSVLVNMYSKKGDFESARHAFDYMCERNVVSWTTLISVCAEHHQFMDALHFLNQMQQEAVLPNKVTLVSTLNVCAKNEAIQEGKQVHARIVHGGVEVDNIVENAIIAMYSQCGSVADAQRVFDEACDQDVISWTSLMSSCIHKKQGKRAVWLLQQMQCQGILPDKVTCVTVFTALGDDVALVEAKQLHACIVGSDFLSSPVVINSLVTTYGKCSNIKGAKIAFNSLASPTVVSWTAMMSAYVQCEEQKEILHVFQQMQQEGVMPFKFTLVGLPHHPLSYHPCTPHSLLPLSCCNNTPIMPLSYIHLRPLIHPCTHTLTSIHTYAHRHTDLYRYARNHAVHLTTFDSETELYKLHKLNPEAEAVVRIRVSDPGARCPLGVKYGAELSECENLLLVAKGLGLTVVGVAFHVGSGASDPSSFAEGIAQARQVFDIGKTMGIHSFRLLDIGGGFVSDGGHGVSFAAAAASINDALDRYFPSCMGITVIAEPGRFFAEETFTLASQVFGSRVRSRNGHDVWEYWINDGIYGSMNCLLYDHATLSVRPLQICSSVRCKSVAGTLLVGRNCLSPPCLARRVMASTQ